ncbi:RNA-directed DNA polymerase, eukaryota [Tanacetum coccineum]
MGTYRSKEDDLAKIATSIYITNFPETISAKELFNSCKIYGHVVDSFIPNKRAKNGKRFGFVRFINVFNVERLVSNLCTVWIDRHKLQANIARFKRNNDNGAYAGGKANVGFRDNNMRANNSGIEKVIKQSIDHNAGLGNSYVRAVKGEEKKGAANEKTQPTMVLDDDCLISRDLSHFLMGRVKEFASLAHLKMTISNEGFTDVKIQYLGEFWVMLEFTSKETMKMFQDNVSIGSWFSVIRAASLDFQLMKRIAWVEVEGIPFKLWSSKTFNCIATKWGELLDVDDEEETCYHSKRLCIHTKMVRSISEEFKIIHKGKLYWIRANETPGWVPDFQDEVEDEEQDDNYMKFEGLNEQNSNISDDDNDVERISETMFPLDDQKDINKEEGERDQNVYGPVDEQEKSNKEEGEIGQDTNISEDPFKIYPLLHKKDKIEAVSEGRGENVNLDDHTDRVGSYKNGKPPKKSVESGDNSISSGHFKKSELPRTGGSILAVLEEVIKVGTVMGYKMEGCTSNIAEIIEAKGVEEVNFLALQETKMNDMHVKCVRTCWGNLSFDYVHSEAVGNSGGQNLLIGVVYAPHDIKEKFMLWDYLQCEITRWKGQVSLWGTSMSKIREWNASFKNGTKKDKDQCIRDLVNIDDIIDSGNGGEEDVLRRAEIVNKMQKIDGLLAKELAQKTKIKWAIEGDENSKFFHEFYDHFSARFSIPNNKDASILMDFPKKISEAQLRGLECEVSNDEIKKAVWDCGTEKAPGPDGFTFGFFRHFWYLIHNDVYDAVRYFFLHTDIPKGCNSSFIALIPKSLNANYVKDFRPISLVGSIYKIIAKILANRLVGVLDDIVNEVQSAFIADRQILDGPFILNEVIQWCKVKKKQALFFKVDFEKAYDSVRWDFLDEVLRKFGFGDKWCKWIQCCLNSSRGSILVNGCPTEEFQYGKGLKQGDPLSPFLFILIMESLHLSFQRIVDEGMFKGIKLGGDMVNLSHMFYADDAVFVGQWCESNITTLVHVLDCFYKVSGLRINMSKSKIMGVHVDDEKVNRAADKLGCLVFKTPFAYLGSIVGGNMSRKHLWNETVDKVKMRLSKWKMNTLSIGGRLTLIKSVLIKKRLGNGKKLMLARNRGGLGISSLYAMNRGLLLKWVWRFVTQKNTLWARVIQALHGVDGRIGTSIKGGQRSCWTSIIQEVNNLGQKGIDFMSLISIKLGNGEKTRFWEDKWCADGILKTKYPRLYALESCKLISVGTKLSHSSICSSFRRNPRGGNELDQLVRLEDDLKGVVLKLERMIVWVLELVKVRGIFVSRIRNRLLRKFLPNVELKTRWNKFIPIKINIHTWKIMTNSLPTRFNISCRGICIYSILCAIYGKGVETTSHLFFSCNGEGRW